MRHPRDVHRWFRGCAAVAVIFSATLSATATDPSASASSAPTWTAAALLPGVAALDVGRHASADVVSCPTGTSCVTVGTYVDKHGFTQGFADSMINGVWQSPIEVEGLATLNVMGSMYFSSVACSSAGYCSATGEYETIGRHYDAFVLNEIAGRWHDAERVPGLTYLQGLYVRQMSYFSEMTCVPGPNLDCEMGGLIAGLSSFYVPGATQAVVDHEVNGVWYLATLVPWPTSESFWGLQSWVGAIACPRVGSCTIVVDTGASYYSYQGTFIETETDFKWSPVTQLPGLTKFSDGASHNESWGYALACPSLGNCVAAGTFQDFWVPFRATETANHWAKATGVTGLDGLYSQAEAVSCAAVTTCSIVGLTAGADGDHQYTFETYEVAGKWTTAVYVPGLSALGPVTYMSGFACDPADTCVLTGNYWASYIEHPYVETSVKGAWASATPLAGATALPGVEGESANDLSCAPDGGCAIVGNTLARSGLAKSAFYSYLPPEK